MRRRYPETIYCDCCGRNIESEHRCNEISFAANPHQYKWRYVKALWALMKRYRNFKQFQNKTMLGFHWNDVCESCWLKVVKKMAKIFQEVAWENRKK